MLQRYGKIHERRTPKVDDHGSMSVSGILQQQAKSLGSRVI